IWEAASSKQVWVYALAAPQTALLGTGVGRLAFSPDGKLLALGGVGNAIRVLDVAEAKQIHAIGHQAPITQLSYACDGKTLLATDRHGVVVAWETAEGKELRRRNPSSRLSSAIALSADGRHFVSYRPTGTIFIHDAITGSESRSVKEVVGFGNVLAVSPDNRLVAFPVIDNDTALIAIYDLIAEKERHRLLPPVGDVDPDGVNTQIPLGVPSRFSFSPDGQFLAAPYDGHRIVLWNVLTGQEHCRIDTGPRSGIVAFAFSQDSRSLIVDHGGTAPGLWETATGSLRRRFGTQ